MSAKLCRRSQLMRSSPGVCGPRSIRRAKRGRLRRHLEHALDVVRVARHPAAARLDHQVGGLQAVEARLDLGFGRLHYRRAAALLVAARDRRVEREGIAVRHCVLLLVERAENAGLEKESVLVIGLPAVLPRTTARQAPLRYDSALRMSYLVGIDIGGTFTDCAIVDRAGKLLTTNSLDAGGFLARHAGRARRGRAGARPRARALLPRHRVPFARHHGRHEHHHPEARRQVGLITTKGHEDAIHIMRGSRGYGGRDIRKVVHFPETSKPQPIVPKRLIRGVSERSIASARSSFR